MEVPLRGVTTCCVPRTRAPHLGVQIPPSLELAAVASKGWLPVHSFPVSDLPNQRARTLRPG